MADQVKVGSDFEDSLIVAGVKVALERGLAPFIGNGTLQSGALKIVGAKFAGDLLKKALPSKWAKYVEMALVIDGAEDIAVSLMANMNIPFAQRSEPAFM